MYFSAMYWLCWYRKSFLS